MIGCNLCLMVVQGDADKGTPKTIVQLPSVLLKPMNSLHNVIARRAAQLTNADAAEQGAILVQT